MSSSEPAVAIPAVRDIHRQVAGRLAGFFDPEKWVRLDEMRARLGGALSVLGGVEDTLTQIAYSLTVGPVGEVCDLATAEGVAAYVPGQSRVDLPLVDASLLPGNLLDTAGVMDPERLIRFLLLEFLGEDGLLSKASAWLAAIVEAPTTLSEHVAMRLAALDEAAFERLEVASRGWAKLSDRDARLGSELANAMAELANAVPKGSPAERALGSALSMLQTAMETPPVGTPTAPSTDAAADSQA